jgi:hypothetical protein
VAGELLVGALGQDEAGGAQDGAGVFAGRGEDVDGQAPRYSSSSVSMTTLTESLAKRNEMSSRDLAIENSR